LSILSPCHLASIPLIVGFIDEQGQMNVRRAFVTSNLAVGILISIALIGLAENLRGDSALYFMEAMNELK